jgi:hypothetical protein
LIEHVTVQPGAPPPLQGHLCKSCHCRHAHDGRDQREKNQSLVQDSAAIMLVDGIEHRAVPYVQPILQDEIHQRHGEGCERQQPCGATPPVPPEAQGRFPKACEQVLPGLLLGI